MDDVAKYKVNYLTHCRDGQRAAHRRLNIDVSRFRFQTQWTSRKNRDESGQEFEDRRIGKSLDAFMCLQLQNM